MMKRKTFLATLALSPVMVKELLASILVPGTDKSLERLVRCNEMAAPYIDSVFEATQKHKAIYELPAAFAAWLFHHESAYNHLAMSPDFALGIAQFMPETAEFEGLKTFLKHDGEKYKMIRELQKRKNRQKNIAKRLFEKAEWINNPRELERLKKAKQETDKLERLCSQTYKETKDYYLKKLEEMTPEQINDYDQRANPFMAIDKGVLLLAKNARLIKKEFALNDQYVLLLSASAYNAGMGRVYSFKGVPNFSETLNYVNKLIMTYGKS